MKTVSFLTLISIVIITILISLTIYYNQVFQQKYKQELEKLDLNQKVYDLAKQLANCLGFEYEHVYYLDYNKIEEFSKEYKEIEPRCAIAKDFDYNVEIIQFEKEIRNYPSLDIYKERGGIAEEILNLINKNSTIFVLDVSGSMGASDTPPCEEFLPGRNTRICCLKKFTFFFLENLDNNTEIGISFFGLDSCGFKYVINPYKKVEDITNSEKQEIINAYPDDGTPIQFSLFDAANKAKENSFIVLLTDGGENCGRVSYNDVVSIIKNKNITLISIGFGKGADKNYLKKLSQDTNGYVFFAEDCEELVSRKMPFENKSIKIEMKKWNFSLEIFGPKISLEAKVSIPVFIKYNETFIVEGLLTIKAYKGFLEEIYSFLDDLCSKDLNIEISKNFYFDYNVRVIKENNYYKVCSEDVCKKLICKYEIEEKEFNKGDNIIRIKIEGNKMKIS